MKLSSVLYFFLVGCAPSVFEAKDFLQKETGLVATEETMSMPWDCQGNEYSFRFNALKKDITNNNQAKAIVCCKTHPMGGCYVEEYTIYHSWAK